MLHNKFYDKKEKEGKNSANYSQTEVTTFLWLERIFFSSTRHQHIINYITFCTIFAFYFESNFLFLLQESFSLY